MADVIINGAQYNGVPSIIVPDAGGGNAEFYDMSGDMSFLGKNAECINSNFYSFSDTLANTDFAGWTPSTTARTLEAAKTVGTFSADLADYDYYLVWDCRCDPAYTGTPTLKAHTLFARCYIVQEICKRPSNWANIEADSFNGNACASLYAGNFLRYYGTTTGSVTYSWSASYGFYFSAASATFSSSTSNTPTVTVKTPAFYSRCSTTYFSTANAKLVDQENSTWSMQCKLYRVKSNGVLRGIYGKVVDIINEQ